MTPQDPPAVTRFEVVMGVSPAFQYGRPDRSQILSAADQTGARPEVVALLRKLPDRRYDAPNDLWVELPDVPVEL
jgi:hypothetical protein